MLEVRNMTMAYDGTPVFSNLSVSFQPGKITGIIGPNGAGKSTLIKGILDLVSMKAGKITYQNQPVKKFNKKIAYVEQRKEIDLSFPIHVFDVVLTGSYARTGLFKSPSKKEKAKALGALKQVSLEGFEKRQIGSLSGGQLQRVFVARGILQEAEIVILDEPFVGIDMKSESQIMTIIKEWKAQGKTIIIVHHDLNKVYDYFDELVILNHGIVASGKTRDVYTSKNIEQAFSADLSQVLFAEKGGA